MKDGKRWLVVAGYAVAMAWVEAAVVFYLRTMAGRIIPYQPDPLPKVAGLGWVEMVREAATLVMLLGVGFLAGRNWRSRWAYAAVAFGLWDIFYYLFLRIITHWPHSAFDWDILFLLPLPWWGPVIAPVIIALLMIAWGTVVSQWDHESPQFRPAWMPWFLGLIGVSLALYVFMADSIRVAGRGSDAVRQMLPVKFSWASFALAVLLMSAPAASLAWRLFARRRNESQLNQREASHRVGLRTKKYF